MREIDVIATCNWDVMDAGKDGNEIITDATPGNQTRPMSYLVMEDGKQFWESSSALMEGSYYYGLPAHFPFVLSSLGLTKFLHPN